MCGTIQCVVKLPLPLGCCCQCDPAPWAEAPHHNPTPSACVLSTSPQRGGGTHHVVRFHLLRTVTSCLLSPAAYFPLLLTVTSCSLSLPGFEHYEVSNYALPGHRCRHNMVYWEGLPYYAFGMGAASYLEVCGGVRCVWRWGACARAAPGRGRAGAGFLI